MVETGEMEGMTDGSDRESGEHAILRVAEWVVTAGLGQMPPAALLAGLCERLNGIGVSVARSQASFRILHPLFGAMTVTWREDEGSKPELQPGDNSPGSEFDVSPVAAMLREGRRMMRQRLEDPGSLRFPLLVSLAGKGFTDYIAFVVAFGEREPRIEQVSGVVISFATRRPGGFTDGEIESLRWLSSPVGLALQAEINREIAWSTLRTFHGSVVGSRILGGTIKRGAGERLRTVLWYSDLRNSTALGESLELDGFLALLNAYFDCTAGAVLACGGQVLELIGDAVLGIFPVEAAGSEAEACRAGIAAARLSRQRLADLAVRDQSLAGAIEFGVGVHVGEVIFGNVGTADRLSFGVVGSAVSETARMETLTKAIGRPIVASDRVAACLDEKLEDLGRHAMRGVEGKRRIWAVPANVQELAGA
jgi:adenylate cyclase